MRCTIIVFISHKNKKQQIIFTQMHQKMQKKMRSDMSKDFYLLEINNKRSNTFILFRSQDFHCDSFPFDCCQYCIPYFTAC